MYPVCGVSSWAFWVSPSRGSFPRALGQATLWTLLESLPTRSCPTFQTQLRCVSTTISPSTFGYGWWEQWQVSAPLCTGRPRSPHRLPVDPEPKLLPGSWHSPLRSGIKIHFPCPLSPHPWVVDWEIETWRSHDAPSHWPLMFTQGPLISSVI